MKNKKIKIILKIIILIVTIILMLTVFILKIVNTKYEYKTEKTTNRLETEEFMGRKIYTIIPESEKKTQTTILYFHGGSYVAKATKDHFEFLENIVDQTGATVIMPDYPLAPKYNYKDVFNMVVPLYKNIIENIEPKNLVLMGDSAGGGLSLALEEKLLEENIEKPIKTILISPWLDVRLENPKIDEVQKQDDELNKETLKIAGIMYSAGDEKNNYLVNPIDGNLSNLENITILTGTRDILNPDAHKLQEKASEVGTNIELKEYEGAKHIWMIEKNSSQELIESANQDIINMLNLINTK